LLQLDCRPLQKEIDFRAASLAAAEAALTRVRNGPRPEEVAIGEAAVGVATARAEEAHDALDRASALQIGVSITRAELFVVERDSRVADAQLQDAQKKLALLKAGSRAEDIAEAQAKRDAAAAFLDEGKAELDQCAVRAPAPGTVQVVATIGQFVSVFSPTPLIQLTTDGATK
jgi:multidrug resistance efflux pump